VDELEWTSSISDVSCLRVLGLCVDAVNDLQEGHFHNYLQVNLILMTYVKRLAYKAIGLSTGAGPYGLPVGLPVGIPAKTLTCRSRLPVAAGP
jgi:hypothetical protein